MVNKLELLWLEVNDPWCKHNPLKYTLIGGARSIPQDFKFAMISTV